METAQRMAAPVNLCRDDSGSRRGRTDDDQLQGKRQFTDKAKSSARLSLSLRRIIVAVQ
jgi:hypothetical protein